eukprot:SAG31_NODE_3937_length_3736_cov_1.195766_5_plen_83_part_00
MFPGVNTAQSSCSCGYMELHEGFLTKKGGIRRNWLVRWFVLDSTGLKYYHDDAKGTPIGQIKLVVGRSAARISEAPGSMGAC